MNELINPIRDLNDKQVVQVAGLLYDLPEEGSPLPDVDPKPFVVEAVFEVTHKPVFINSVPEFIQDLRERYNAIVSGN